MPSCVLDTPEPVPDDVTSSLHSTASSSSQHAATSHKHRSKSSTFTPVNFKPAKRKHRQRSSKGETSPNKTRKRLLGQFPCQKRKGMTCSADTAWHKRSFDSLTSHTFFMSKREYGKKVVKAIILHRTCAVCKWWKRKRPGEKVKTSMCT